MISESGDFQNRPAPGNLKNAGIPDDCGVPQLAAAQTLSFPRYRIFIIPIGQLFVYYVKRVELDDTVR